MPTSEQQGYAQKFSGVDSQAAIGSWGFIEVTGTGTETAPAGYVFFAVLARVSDATAGTCVKDTKIPGDVVPSGSVFTYTEGPVVIGPHSALAFSTNADAVWAYLIPAP